MLSHLNGWKWIAVALVILLALVLAVVFGGWTWDDGVTLR